MATIRKRRGRENRLEKPVSLDRSLRYRHLRHPFAPQGFFTEDAIINIHNMALKVLEELGMKILLDDARKIFKTGGAIVNETDLMVRMGREMVTEALKTAPKSIPIMAINPDRRQQFELGTLMFAPAGGCPNTTNLERGRRPGCYADFEETVKLHQSFDVIHQLGPSAEPQDIAPELRHYATMNAQMTLSDKPMFLYSRGQKQVEQAFEMIRIGFNLTDAEFAAGTWASTVINTNSPRMLDIPMAQGIMDFARAGQLCIITPFCLAGAMAPITVEGALVLQHAEALAAITLSQLTKPGAPVAYGGFGSNVDMKSGAPAFGTPEQVKMTLGTGQLARYIDLPWRSAGGSASNVADMQAGLENNMAMWATVMAQATVVKHSAGWLEGGLTFGYEKFINDIEALQSFAELCQPPEDSENALAWSALEQVNPGGHFFDTGQTMRRYKDAFYQPLVADLSNFGAWTESGAQTSTERAYTVWKDVLANYRLPDNSAEISERLRPYIKAVTDAGGAPPVA
jgi:trimethylamine--corrinoid protein Co-methyltransferase